MIKASFWEVDDEKVILANLLQKDQPLSILPPKFHLVQEIQVHECLI